MKQVRVGWFCMVLEDDFLNDDWEVKFRPVWKGFKPTENEKCILIKEMPLEFDVPDDFDPRGKQIQALEKQKRDMTAKFQAAVTEINARIQSLQAIELEPSHE